MIVKTLFIIIFKTYTYKDLYFGYIINNILNNIQCDECGAGYRPGMLADCMKCKGEFCDTCHRDHKCKN